MNIELFNIDYLDTKKVEYFLNENNLYKRSKNK